MRYLRQSVAFTIVFGMSLSCVWLVQAQQNTTAPGGTGIYSDLQPQQKRLVDDWFKRFSEVLKKPVDPEEAYGQLPLSVRTTFNAVTHALLRIPLTDSSGRSLAESAITLVERVDSVAGRVPGAGGDHQFRIYVQLKKGILETLDQSNEFHRGADNTVFHKGYPISYRSPGTPSVQISMTRDGSSGDIDVDYRSSKFPAALINGHLTASNSDVRAGNNDVRHNGRWNGLSSWWRNLFGLSLLERPAAAEDNSSSLFTLKTKYSKPDDAVYDFLNSWLVEQKPEESIPYFAEQAYRCLEVERGGPVDRGMSKFELLRAMQQVNSRIGKIPSLSNGSVGVLLTGERVKTITQAHHAEFVLYDVREDLAEQFNCVNKLDNANISLKASQSKAFGKYVGAVFRLKTPDTTGETVATLWKKEDGYWHLISFDVDPVLDQRQIPNTAVPIAAVPPLSYTDGDKDMIVASKDFLEQWLVKKNLDKALTYVAPKSLACLNIYRDEDVPAPATPEQARQLLRSGMERTQTTVGKAGRLKDAIIAAEPHHPDLKLVKHSNSEAYVVVSIPVYMADAVDCENRKPGETLDFQPSAATGYGRYYAVGFTLNAGMDSNGAVLWIVWDKVDNSWKAVSYALLTP